MKAIIMKIIRHQWRKYNGSNEIISIISMWRNVNVMKWRNGKIIINNISIMAKSIIMASKAIISIISNNVKIMKIMKIMA
jgi:hypothetical protein